MTCRRSALPSRLLVLPALLLLGAVVLAGCGGEARSETAASDEPPTAAVPVEVAAVEVGTASAYFAGTASIEAEEEATVVARTGGVVEGVLVEEGTFVQAGQPLLQLDDERLRLERERTAVELAKVERIYERSQAVYDKGLISAEEFERIRSDYETQRVAHDLAEVQLGYATVRAPIAGVVSQRLIKTGNMVAENEPVFRVTGLDPLRAVVHVPERELSRLQEGQPATLRFDAVPDTSFAGRVKLISPTVDPETGTFRAVVELRDPSRRVKPGMFGRVRIQNDERSGVLLVPKQAVMEEDDEQALFVVADTLALRRVVETGYEEGNRVEIRAGLAEGEAVVITGQATLQDSARVEVIGGPSVP